MGVVCSHRVRNFRTAADGPVIGFQDPSGPPERTEIMRDPERPDPDLPRVEAELDSWLAEALPELLPRLPLSDLGRARLLGAAESWPLRYAPLYDQLGELWDLADPELETVFSLAADTKGWQRAWPGFRNRSRRAEHCSDPTPTSTRR